MDNKLEKKDIKKRRRKPTTIPQRRPLDPKRPSIKRDSKPKKLISVSRKPSIKVKKIEPNFTIKNRRNVYQISGSTEGMRDAAKIEGKPHSSPEGQFESKMRSIPLKVVTFKNGGKVRIAKRGGGRAYGQNS